MLALFVAPRILRLSYKELEENTGLRAHGRWADARIRCTCSTCSNHHNGGTSK